MNRKYGVSTVSFAPWSLGPGAPLRTVRMARDAGYDGIQFLPLRGWGDTPLRHWEKDVLAFEDAWNYGTWGEALLRHIDKRRTGPTLLDLILFRSEYSTFFPNAVPSVHHFQLGVATEVYPDLETKTEAYVDFVAAGGALCWDTWHSRRPRRDGLAGIPNWEQLLHALPENAVKLIHVHPVRHELVDFWNGIGELIYMLGALRERFPAVTAIVEVAPTIQTKKATITALSNLRKHIAAYLG